MAKRAGAATCSVALAAAGSYVPARRRPMAERACAATCSVALAGMAAGAGISATAASTAAATSAVAAGRSTVQLVTGLA